jgi:hypothetical protein
MRSLRLCLILRFDVRMSCCFYKLIGVGVEQFPAGNIPHCRQKVEVDFQVFLQISADGGCAGHLSQVCISIRLISEYCFETNCWKPTKSSGSHKQPCFKPKKFSGGFPQLAGDFQSCRELRNKIVLNERSCWVVCFKVGFNF